MIINGSSLLRAMPIAAMADKKRPGPGGTSWGLGEAGYDIRIAEEIRISPVLMGNGNYRWLRIAQREGTRYKARGEGRFCLASAMEEFQMPTNLVGLVKDKSTWARQGLSVFNTVIEPGWTGFLTLELVYHGSEELVIPAGAGIAQVIFEETSDDAAYSGKYQNQERGPQAARFKA